MKGSRSYKYEVIQKIDRSRMITCNPCEVGEATGVTLSSQRLLQGQQVKFTRISIASDYLRGKPDTYSWIEQEKR